MSESSNRETRPSRPRPMHRRPRSTEGNGDTVIDQKLLAELEREEPLSLAEELDISLNTARVHVQRVLSKTSSPRQADLASLLVQLGALTELSRARPPRQAPGSSADPTE